MTVGIKLGGIVDEIGAPDFFHAFFSTVSGNLEPDGWATRFPVVMRNLYEGRVSPAEAKQCLKELAEIKSAFSALTPRMVIWDIEDRSKSPPWGSSIAATITDLSNYFVTSTGRDLFDLLEEVLKEGADGSNAVEVVNY